MNSTATNCNEDECEGQFFQFMALLPGQYLMEMEMAPDIIDHDFQVEMVCTDVYDQLEERGTIFRMRFHFCVRSFSCTLPSSEAIYKKHSHTLTWIIGL